MSVHFCISKTHVQTSPNLLPVPWIDPSLITMQHVMYFQVYGLLVGLSPFAAANAFICCRHCGCITIVQKQDNHHIQQQIVGQWQSPKSTNA